VVAITAALLVRAFVLQQFAVSGHSMDTTLHDARSRVLVNKLSYRLHDPNRGDVVVLKTIEGTGERDLIKRVVALPGETVEYRSCVLYIDGRELVEPYLDPQASFTPTSCGQGNNRPLEVPANHVFVMGDNRGRFEGQPGRKSGPDQLRRPHRPCLRGDLADGRLDLALVHQSTAAQSTVGGSPPSCSRYASIIRSGKSLYTPSRPIRKQRSRMCGSCMSQPNARRLKRCSERNHAARPVRWCMLSASMPLAARVAARRSGPP
jgi:signal peptidase I